MKNKILLGVGIVLGILLLYTRFMNLEWGLPYPFHPDERNMADALMRLECTGWNTECFNPHFFAYGQLPLYLGYGLVMISHLVKNVVQTPISFVEAVLALRILSASASVLTVVLLLRTLDIFVGKDKNKIWLLAGAAVLFIFSPGLIQFAHFGTTESLLMLFYSAVVYLSTMLLKEKLSLLWYSILAGVVCGLAIATKISALSFGPLPLAVVIFSIFSEKTLGRFKKIESLVLSFTLLGAFSGLFAFLFSPHNFIAFNEFLRSIQYESAIGLGELAVFYTRQFQMTAPILFQFISIVPFALGIPVALLFLGGFYLLPNKKEYIFLRFAFLLYFLPSAFLFTKWTRFMAPVFPLMLLIAVLFSIKILEWARKKSNELVFRTLFIVITGLAVLPGIAFISVYKNPDIRFTASEWMYKNIPANSVILSETANTVDLPIATPQNLQLFPAERTYQVLSFNFYDLDTEPVLQQQLGDYLEVADYIVIPSRRIFANHTCHLNSLSDIAVHDKKCEYLKKTYPLLADYYDALFTEKLGFVKVKEFSAAPKVQLGQFKLEFPDEQAEETWTVFDHPVIKVYKRK